MNKNLISENYIEAKEQTQLKVFVAVAFVFSL